MEYRFLRAALGVALLINTGACGGPTGPDSGEAVEISLAVSGGIEGVNWRLTVDGGAGWIVGNGCDDQRNCDWEDGEVLGTFDAAALTDLAGKFFEGGFFDGPADFGSECCDQFDYVLSYRDVDDDRSVSGSDGTIPQNVRSLILLVEQFVADVRG